MQALLSYLDSASIPAAARPNVSGQPVRSLTLGMVNQRQAGYGISAATTHDQLRLLQLLVALTHDPYIAGGGPQVYTSICLNVDFASGLHSDANNSDEYDSWIVSLGDHDGGNLWIEKSAVGEREAPCSIEHAGASIMGVAVPVRHRWYHFAGSRRHCTLPYTGFRVSVVYFSVPTDKCDPADLARLHHLGFKVPSTRPFGAQHRWPYDVFICTTRRSNTIERDTLNTVFSDGSVPRSAANLCLRDAEDVRAYRRLDLRIIVSEDGRGLPEQRTMCTRYLPEGSWVLYLDDDVTHIHRPAHLSVHHLIMLAFLTSQHRHVKLWGLNTSSDTRNLRDNVSGQLGLINGYLFGVIVCGLRVSTPISDLVGGAAEDIERSLRYFAHSGLARLNFATACARTRTNAGGLQDHYASDECRQAAHKYVLHALAVEFPGLVAVDLATPNGCRFRQPAAPKSSADYAFEDRQNHVSWHDRSAVGQPAEHRLPPGGQAIHQPFSEPATLEDADIDDLTTDAQPGPEAGLLAGGCARAAPPSVEERSLDRAAPRNPQKRVCHVCGKEFSRNADLRHHLLHAHRTGAPPPSFECPLCFKSFRKKKDMLVHVRMQRCHSKRGRQYVAISAT